MPSIIAVDEYPSDWSSYSSKKKRQWRFANWRRSIELAAYASPEVKNASLVRTERLISAYNLEESDRVPLSGAIGMLPFSEAGLNYHDSINNPDKAGAAIRAFNRQHAEELDSIARWAYVGIAAPALNILGIKMYAYPGHGMPEGGIGFQFVEGEYMFEDEYDAFLRDPSDFWIRTYLPRAFQVFEPCTNFAPLTEVVEINNMHLWDLARLDVQDMLEKMLAAGRELNRYQELQTIDQAEALLYGFPLSPPAFFAKAPFDTIGDTLRGTRQVIMDMFRKPEKLLEAVDLVADLTIRSVLDSPRVTESIIVRFPLHKGADGWMSQEQFLKFYWPSLRKVINAFTDEGLLVNLFAEGSYDSRLELVNEFPKGSIVWQFDRTNMTRAKSVLGDMCCLEGNIPSSLLVAGEPKDVVAECRGLIEVCGSGGGYILGPGAIPEQPKLENLRAMAEAVREYGAYN